MAIRVMQFCEKAGEREMVD